MNKQGMKYGFLLLLLLAAGSLAAQDSLMQARLRSLRGTVAPFSVVAKKDSLFLICFWSAASDESISALNAINAALDKWKGAIPFRFLAVSVDEGKQINRVRPVYNMNSWTFEVFTDLYGDLRRALQSNNLPQSMILFKGRVIYQQSGWSPGSEHYLFQKLVDIHAGRM
jgi:hypothetical protein